MADKSHLGSVVWLNSYFRLLYTRLEKLSGMQRRQGEKYNYS